MTRVMLYTRFERFWHWAMALLILGMLITGFEVHVHTLLITISYNFAIFASMMTAHPTGQNELNSCKIINWRF